MGAGVNRRGLAAAARVVCGVMGWAVLVQVPCAAQSFGSPLRPLPPASATPAWPPPVQAPPDWSPPPPPNPSQLTVQEYTYVVAQNSHIMALLAQIRDALVRDDQAHSAILTQVRELEVRLGRQVREEGVGDLSKVLTGAMAAGGALFSGYQALRNAPKCQP